MHSMRDVEAVGSVVEYYSFRTGPEGVFAMGNDDGQPDDTPSASQPPSGNDSRMRQQPGRDQHATEQGHPLQHLKGDRDASGPPKRRKRSTEPQPSGPVGGQQPPDGDAASTSESRPEQASADVPAVQHTADPPATTGDDGDDTQKKILIAVGIVFGLFLLGSCCIAGGLLFSWQLM